MESGTYEEKRDLVLKIGQNLLLKDGKIVMTFRKPYDILLQPTYRTNVLPRVDSNYEPCRYTISLIFIKVWTISLPRINLGIGHIVSEPSSLYRQAWLRITIPFLLIRIRLPVN